MRVRKRRLEQGRRTALGLVLVLMALACEPSRAHDVTIVDGSETTHFTTKSAFAEYVELPGARNELRITLASYTVSCEHWVAPKDGELALLVTVVTPADQKPAPASYAWTGIPPHDQPIPHEGYALPKALLGSHSRLFDPGGSVRLATVSLDLHTALTGALAFEYPGDGNRPATRIDGVFEAKICRSSVAAH